MLYHLLHIAKKPRLYATITVKKGLIAHIKLRLSDSFTASIEGDTEVSPKIVDAITETLRCYANKKEFSAVPFKEFELTAFQQDTLREIQNIPFGQVASYKEIAEKIGRPRAFRAVGNACHLNPYPLLIPCHRVIAADGSLGGFGFDIEVKKSMLSFEAS